MGNPPPLRVDTPALTWDPAVVTVPPVPTIPAGSDPMSLLISAVMPELAAPLTADVAATHAREEQFAANLAEARSAYQSTDQAGEQEIRTVADAQLAPLNAPAPRSAGGQPGQFLTTSMQTATTAAQAPAQLMGITAAAPQGLIQGVQHALQQSGQLSGQVNKPTGERDDHSGPEQERDPGDDDGAGSAVEGAAAGDEVSTDTPGPRRQRDQAGGVEL